MPNGNLDENISKREAIEIRKALVGAVHGFTDQYKVLQSIENIIRGTDRNISAILSLVRTLDVQQYEFYGKIEKAAGTSADVISSEMMKPGWTYEILNIIAYNSGSGISQASLGYLSGATFMLQKKGSTDNPFHTVEYHHHVFLKEGDQIRCEFSNATADDTLYYFANGLKRRI